jgi:hypothetical protein
MDKDRRTRMAGSSLNQPVKKGGTGSFGWGLAAEYGPEDLQTCFPREATVAPSKFTVAPASESTMVAKQSSWSMPEMMNDVEFPALSTKLAAQSADVRGLTHMTSPTPDAALPSEPTLSLQNPPSSTVLATEQPAQFVQPPSVAGIPAAVASKEVQQSRSAAVDCFDAQHPRNQFARNPRRAACQQETSETVEDDFVIVDWSSTGTSAVSSAILQQNTNSAHLSPYVKPQPPAAHSELKHIARQSSVKRLRQQPQNCRRSSSRKPIMSRQPAVRCR